MAESIYSSISTKDSWIGTKNNQRSSSNRKYNFDWNNPNSSSEQFDNSYAAFASIFGRTSYERDWSINVIPPNITVTNIKGISFSLPDTLESLKEEIIEAGALLDLDENWDEEGANATNIQAFKKAIDFLVNYSKYIAANHNSILLSPHIDITRDGSISAFWETESAQMLIIFKKTNTHYSYLYGEEKNAEISIPFSRAVRDGNEIDEITALWMYKNLTQIKETNSHRKMTHFV